MKVIEKLKSEIREAAKAALGGELDEVVLDAVPEGKPGDLCWNAFRLAKELGKKPPEVTQPIADKLAESALVGATHVQGGFLNVELSSGPFLEGLIGEIKERGDQLGRAPASGKHVVVEFSAPNTNKPQHLGHVRNNLLGMAVTNLLEAAGHQVTRVNLVNDRGIHICKSMLAYERWGEGATPESRGQKGDHMVGEFYVRYSAEEKAQADALVAAEAADDKARLDELKGLGKKASKDEKKELKALAKKLEELELSVAIHKEAQELLRKWEAGDSATIALWEKLNGWVLEGFGETYESLGIRFDKVYFESQTWSRGRQIVEQGLESGVFQKEDNGAVSVDLAKWKLGKKILLRADGTALYMTQDLATTQFKVDDYHPDWQVWVVGDEQKHHFEVLFKVLELLGHDWAPQCHHLAYGMINLPKGMGKMKSREGRAVDADNLRLEVTELARAEILERLRGKGLSLPDEELDERSRVIALAAIKFMILRISADTTMIYDPEASVQFTGATGPYLLYSYARIRSIEREVEPLLSADPDCAKLVDPHEKALGLALSRHHDVIQAAASTYNPALLANHLFEMAQTFSTFYDQCHIKNCDDPALQHARLDLARAVGTAIGTGLDLLGIEKLEQM